MGYYDLTQFSVDPTSDPNKFAIIVRNNYSATNTWVGIWKVYDKREEAEEEIVRCRPVFERQIDTICHIIPFDVSVFNEAA